MMDLLRAEEKATWLRMSVDILPSTMLDLAKYPADAFSALLNIIKHDPVTREEGRKEWCFSLLIISLYSDKAKTTGACSAT